MSMIIDPAVAKMFQVLTGQEWPEVDEDKLWAMGRRYQAASTDLGRILADFAGTASGVKAAYGGDGAASFAAWADRVGGRDDRAAMPWVRASCAKMGKACNDTALDVQYTKWITVAELIQLAVEGAVLTALAVTSFGSTFAAWLWKRALVKALLKTWWRRILVLVALHFAFSVGSQVLLDVLVQVHQMNLKYREHWDLKKTEHSAKVGLIGAGLGLVLMPLGNLAFDKLASKIWKGERKALAEMSDGMKLLRNVDGDIAAALGAAGVRGHALSYTLAYHFKEFGLNAIHEGLTSAFASKILDGEWKWSVWDFTAGAAGHLPGVAAAIGEKVRDTLHPGEGYQSLPDVDDLDFPGMDDDNDTDTDTAPQGAAAGSVRRDDTPDVTPDVTTTPMATIAPVGTAPVGTTPVGTTPGITTTQTNNTAVPVAATKTSAPVTAARTTVPVPAAADSVATPHAPAQKASAETASATTTPAAVTASVVLEGSPTTSPTTSTERSAPASEPATTGPEAAAESSSNRNLPLTLEETISKTATMEKSFGKLPEHVLEQAATISSRHNGHSFAIEGSQDAGFELAQQRLGVMLVADALRQGGPDAAVAKARELRAERELRPQDEQRLRGGAVPEQPLGENGENGESSGSGWHVVTRYVLDRPDDAPPSFTSQPDLPEVSRSGPAFPAFLPVQPTVTHDQPALQVSGDLSLAMIHVNGEVKEVYTSPGAFERSTAKLRQAGSEITLVQDTAHSVRFEGTTLYRVQPKFRTDALPDVCRDFAAKVLGGAPEHFVFRGNGTTAVAPTSPDATMELTGTHQLAQALAEAIDTDLSDVDPKWAARKVASDRRESAAEGTGPLPGREYGSALHSGAGNGRRRSSMTTATAALSVNEHAWAEVGEGYVVQSIATADPDGKPAFDVNYARDGGTSQVFGYHFGAVVLQSEDGTAQVTLENYNRSAYHQKAAADAIEQNIEHYRGRWEQARAELLDQRATAPAAEAARIDQRLKLLDALRELAEHRDQPGHDQQVKQAEAVARLHLLALGSLPKPADLWYFRMYGKTEGTTFHEQWSGRDGDGPATMVNPLTVVVVGGHGRRPERVVFFDQGSTELTAGQEGAVKRTARELARNAVWRKNNKLPLPTIEIVGHGNHGVRPGQAGRSGRSRAKSVASRLLKELAQELDKLQQDGQRVVSVDDFTVVRKSAGSTLPATKTPPAMKTHARRRSAVISVQHPTADTLRRVSEESETSVEFVELAAELQRTHGPSDLPAHEADRRILGMARLLASGAGVPAVVQIANGVDITGRQAEQPVSPELEARFAAFAAEHLRGLTLPEPELAQLRFALRAGEKAAVALLDRIVGDRAMQLPIAEIREHLAHEHPRRGQGALNLAAELAGEHFTFGTPPFQVRERLAYVLVVRDLDAAKSVAARMVALAAQDPDLVAEKWGKRRSLVEDNTDSVIQRYLTELDHRGGDRTKRDITLRLAVHSGRDGVPVALPGTTGHAWLEVDLPDGTSETLAWIEPGKVVLDEPGAPRTAAYEVVVSAEELERGLQHAREHPAHGYSGTVQFARRIFKVVTGKPAPGRSALRASVSTVDSAIRGSAGAWISSTGVALVREEPETPHDGQTASAAPQERLVDPRVEEVLTTSLDDINATFAELGFDDVDDLTDIAADILGPKGDTDLTLRVAYALHVHTEDVARGVAAHGSGKAAQVPLLDQVATVGVDTIRLALGTLPAKAAATLAASVSDLVATRLPEVVLSREDVLRLRYAMHTYGSVVAEAFATELMARDVIEKNPSVVTEVVNSLPVAELVELTGAARTALAAAGLSGHSVAVRRVIYTLKTRGEAAVPAVVRRLETGVARLVAEDRNRTLSFSEELVDSVTMNRLLSLREADTGTENRNITLRYAVDRGAQLLTGAWSRHGTGHVWLEVTFPDGGRDAYGFTGVVRGLSSARMLTVVPGMVEFENPERAKTSYLETTISADGLMRGLELLRRHQSAPYFVLGKNCAKFASAVYTAITGLPAPTAGLVIEGPHGADAALRDMAAKSAGRVPPPAPRDGSAPVVVVVPAPEPTSPTDSAPSSSESLSLEQPEEENFVDAAIMLFQQHGPQDLPPEVVHARVVEIADLLASGVDLAVLEEAARGTDPLSFVDQAIAVFRDRQDTATAVEDAHAEVMRLAAALAVQATHPERLKAALASLTADEQAELSTRFAAWRDSHLTGVALPEADELRVRLALHRHGDAVALALADLLVSEQALTGDLTAIRQRLTGEEDGAVIAAARAIVAEVFPQGAPAQAVDRVAYALASRGAQAAEWTARRMARWCATDPAYAMGAWGARRELPLDGTGSLMTEYLNRLSPRQPEWFRKDVVVRLAVHSGSGGTTGHAWIEVVLPDGGIEAFAWTSGTDDHAPGPGVLVLEQAGAPRTAVTEALVSADDLARGLDQAFVNSVATYSAESANSARFAHKTFYAITGDYVLGRRSSVVTPLDLDTALRERAGARRPSLSTVSENSFETLDSDDGERSPDQDALSVLDELLAELDVQSTADEDASAATDAVLAELVRERGRDLRNALAELSPDDLDATFERAEQALVPALGDRFSLETLVRAAYLVWTTDQPLDHATAVKLGDLPLETRGGLAGPDERLAFRIDLITQDRAQAVLDALAPQQRPTLMLAVGGVIAQSRKELGTLSAPQATKLAFALHRYQGRASDAHVAYLIAAGQLSSDIAAVRATLAAETEARRSELTAEAEKLIAAVVPPSSWIPVQSAERVAHALLTKGPVVASAVAFNLVMEANGNSVIPPAHDTHVRTVFEMVATDLVEIEARYAGVPEEVRQEIDEVVQSETARHPRHGFTPSETSRLAVMLLDHGLVAMRALLAQLVSVRECSTSAYSGIVGKLSKLDDQRRARLEESAALILGDSFGTEAVPHQALERTAFAMLKYGIGTAAALVEQFAAEVDVPGRRLHDAYGGHTAAIQRILTTDTEVLKTVLGLVDATARRSINDSVRALVRDHLDGEDPGDLGRLQLSYAAHVYGSPVVNALADYFADSARSLVMPIAKIRSVLDGRTVAERTAVLAQAGTLLAEVFGPVPPPAHAVERVAVELLVAPAYARWMATYMSMVQQMDHALAEQAWGRNSDFGQAVLDSAVNHHIMVVREAGEAGRADIALRIVVNGGAPRLSKQWREEQRIGHAWIEFVLPDGRGDAIGFFMVGGAPAHRPGPGIARFEEQNRAHTAAYQTWITAEQADRGLVYALRNQSEKYFVFSTNCVQFAATMFELMSGRKAPSTGLLFPGPHDLDQSIRKLDARRNGLSRRRPRGPLDGSDPIEVTEPKPEETRRAAGGEVRVVVTDGLTVHRAAGIAAFLSPQRYQVWAAVLKSMAGAGKLVVAVHTVISRGELFAEVLDDHGATTRMPAETFARHVRAELVRHRGVKQVYFVACQAGNPHSRLAREMAEMLRMPVWAPNGPVLPSHDGLTFEDPDNGALVRYRPGEISLSEEPDARFQELTASTDPTALGGTDQQSHVDQAIELFRRHGPQGLRPDVVHARVMEIADLLASGVDAAALVPLVRGEDAQLDFLDQAEEIFRDLDDGELTPAEASALVVHLAQLLTLQAMDPALVRRRLAALTPEQREDLRSRAESIAPDDLSEADLLRVQLAVRLHGEDAAGVLLDRIVSDEALSGDITDIRDQLADLESDEVLETAQHLVAAAFPAGAPAQAVERVAHALLRAGLMAGEQTARRMAQRTATDPDHAMRAWGARRPLTVDTAESPMITYLSELDAARSDVRDIVLRLVVHHGGAAASPTSGHTWLEVELPDGSVDAFAWTGLFDEDVPSAQRTTPVPGQLVLEQPNAPRTAVYETVVTARDLERGVLHALANAEAEYSATQNSATHFACEVFETITGVSPLGRGTSVTPSDVDAAIRELAPAETSPVHLVREITGPPGSSAVSSSAVSSSGTSVSGMSESDPESAPPDEEYDSDFSSVVSDSSESDVIDLSELESLDDDTTLQTLVAELTLDGIDDVFDRAEPVLREVLGERFHVTTLVRAAYVVATTDQVPSRPMVTWLADLTPQRRTVPANPPERLAFRVLVPSISEVRTYLAELTPDEVHAVTGELNRIMASAPGLGKLSGEQMSRLAYASHRYDDATVRAYVAHLLSPHLLTGDLAKQREAVHTHAPELIADAKRLLDEVRPPGSWLPVDAEIRVAYAWLAHGEDAASTVAHALAQQAISADIRPSWQDEYTDVALEVVATDFAEIKRFVNAVPEDEWRRAGEEVQLAAADYGGHAFDRRTNDRLLYAVLRHDVGAMRTLLAHVLLVRNALTGQYHSIIAALRSLGAGDRAGLTAAATEILANLFGTAPHPHQAVDRVAYALRSYGHAAAAAVAEQFAAEAGLPGHVLRDAYGGHRSAVDRILGTRTLDMAAALSTMPEGTKAEVDRIVASAVRTHLDGKHPGPVVGLYLSYAAFVSGAQVADALAQHMSTDAKALFHPIGDVRAALEDLTLAERAVLITLAGQVVDEVFTYIADDEVHEATPPQQAVERVALAIHLAPDRAHQVAQQMFDIQRMDVALALQAWGPNTDFATALQESAVNHHLQRVRETGDPDRPDIRLRLLVDGGAPRLSKAWLTEVQVGHAWVEFVLPDDQKLGLGFYPDDFGRWTGPGGVEFEEHTRSYSAAYETWVSARQTERGLAYAFQQHASTYSRTSYNCTNFATRMFELVTGRKAPSAGKIVLGPHDLDRSIRDLHAERNGLARRLPPARGGRAPVEVREQKPAQAAAPLRRDITPPSGPDSQVTLLNGVVVQRGDGVAAFLSGQRWQTWRSSLESMSGPGRLVVGVHTVVIAGKLFAELVTDGGRKVVDARTFAQQVRIEASSRTGVSRIYLVACQAGNPHSDIARAVADALWLPVWAPNDILLPVGEGVTFEHADDAAFVVYRPGETALSEEPGALSRELMTSLNPHALGGGPASELTVYFEQGSKQLTSAARDQIDAIGHALALRIVESARLGKPLPELTVVGYGGSSLHAAATGELRAKAVAAALQGVVEMELVSLRHPDPVDGNRLKIDVRSGGRGDRTGVPERRRVVLRITDRAEPLSLDDSQRMVELLPEQRRAEVRKWAARIHRNLPPTRNGIVQYTEEHTAALLSTGMSLVAARRITAYHNDTAPAPKPLNPDTRVHRSPSNPLMPAPGGHTATSPVLSGFLASITELGLDPNSLRLTLTIKVDRGPERGTVERLLGEWGHAWLEITLPGGATETVSFTRGEQAKLAAVRGVVRYGLRPDVVTAAHSVEITAAQLRRGVAFFQERASASYRLLGYNSTSFVREAYTVITGKPAPGAHTAIEGPHDLHTVLTKMSGVDSRVVTAFAFATQAETAGVLGALGAEERAELHDAAQEILRRHGATNPPELDTARVVLALHKGTEEQALQVARVLTAERPQDLRVTAELVLEFEPESKELTPRARRELEKLGRSLAVEIEERARASATTPVVEITGHGNAPWSSAAELRAKITAAALRGLVDTQLQRIRFAATSPLPPLVGNVVITPKAGGRRDSASTAPTGVSSAEVRQWGRSVVVRVLIDSPLETDPDAISSTPGGAPAAKQERARQDVAAVLDTLPEVSREQRVAITPRLVRARVNGASELAVRMLAQQLLGDKENHAEPATPVPSGPRRRTSLPSDPLSSALTRPKDAQASPLTRYLTALENAGVDPRGQKITLTLKVDRGKAHGLRALGHAWMEFVLPVATASGEKVAVDFAVADDTTLGYGPGQVFYQASIDNFVATSEYTEQIDAAQLARGAAFFHERASAKYGLFGYNCVAFVREAYTVMTGKPAPGAGRYLDEPTGFDKALRELAENTDPAADEIAQLLAMTAEELHDGLAELSVHERDQLEQQAERILDGVRGERPLPDLAVRRVAFALLETDEARAEELARTLVDQVPVPPAPKAQHVISDYVLHVAEGANAPFMRKLAPVVEEAAFPRFLPVSPVEQRDRPPLTVSADATLAAVRDGFAQEFFASNEAVDRANRVLRLNRGKVSLVLDDTVSVEFEVNGTRHVLSRVVPEFKSGELSDVCRDFSEAVLGGGHTHAVLRSHPSAPTWLPTQLVPVRTLHGLEVGGTHNVVSGALRTAFDRSTPDPTRSMSETVHRGRARLVGEAPAHGSAWGRAVAGRHPAFESVTKQYGLNEHSRPRLGEAVLVQSVATEVARGRRAYDIDFAHGVRQELTDPFGYHFMSVVCESLDGSMQVTLEATPTAPQRRQAVDEAIKKNLEYYADPAQGQARLDAAERQVAETGTEDQIKLLALVRRIVALDASDPARDRLMTDMRRLVGRLMAPNTTSTADAWYFRDFRPTDFLELEPMANPALFTLVTEQSGDLVTLTADPRTGEPTGDTPGRLTSIAKRIVRTAMWRVREGLPLPEIRIVATRSAARPDGAFATALRQALDDAIARWHLDLPQDAPGLSSADFDIEITTGVALRRRLGLADDAVQLEVETDGSGVRPVTPSNRELLRIAGALGVRSRRAGLAQTASLLTPGERAKAVALAHLAQRITGRAGDVDLRVLRELRVVEEIARREFGVRGPLHTTDVDRVAKQVLGISDVALVTVGERRLLLELVRNTIVPVHTELTVAALRATWQAQESAEASQAPPPVPAPVERPAEQVPTSGSMSGLMSGLTIDPSSDPTIDPTIDDVLSGRSTPDPHAEIDPEIDALLSGQDHDEADLAQQLLDEDMAAVVEALDSAPDSLLAETGPAVDALIGKYFAGWSDPVLHARLMHAAAFHGTAAAEVLALALSMRPSLTLPIDHVREELAWLPQEKLDGLLADAALLLRDLLGDVPTPEQMVERVAHALSVEHERVRLIAGHMAAVYLAVPQLAVAAWGRPLGLGVLTEVSFGLDRGLTERHQQELDTLADRVRQAGELRARLGCPPPVVTVRNDTGVVREYLSVLLPGVVIRVAARTDGPVEVLVDWDLR